MKLEEKSSQSWRIYSATLRDEKNRRFGLGKKTFLPVKFHPKASMPRRAF